MTVRGVRRHRQGSVLDLWGEGFLASGAVDLLSDLFLANRGQSVQRIREATWALSSTPGPKRPY